MDLALPPNIEKALANQARRQGVAPEILVVDVLRQHLLQITPPVPVDDWERKLFSAAIDCGVSVPNAAVSSDGLYD